MIEIRRREFEAERGVLGEFRREIVWCEREKRVIFECVVYSSE